MAFIFKCVARALIAGKIQPGPRSAHQMVGTPTSGGQLWCFGGEFASTKQTNFHHYRDVRFISLTLALGILDCGTRMGKGGDQSAPKCS